MGVDSGFLVYKEVDRLYAKQKLSYADVACPKMMTSNPQLFYGFVCSNYNEYASTPPHRGYEILLKWRNEKFGKTKSYEGITCSQCFVYTSNIDGHFKKAGFLESEIVEIHGSNMEWQCRTPHMCSKEIWRLDPTFRFDVDQESRLMKTENFPKCKNCRTRFIRPHLMMFFDQTYVCDERAYQNFQEWESKISEIESKLGNDAKTVILEIGCGLLVPTVRANVERLLEKWKNSTLVRINPNAREQEDSKIPERTIGISLGARDALEKIDAFIRTD
eukprot:TRINITY_DN10648_c0_g4_i13.p1 TRINITY_DN10648_c0_g4~~TRINITY_DN10648_c0_g4_i13.p1  ORF type:complete len:323 (-),score=66.16 TRINITY_DN10648_c0_g4_i13:806-1630(-)